MSNPLVPFVSPAEAAAAAVEARVEQARNIITAAEADLGGVVAVAHCGGYVDLLRDSGDMTDAQAREVLAILGKNLTPVTITVDLAVDADAWVLNYGDGIAPTVRDDMRNLLREAVEQFVAQWIDSTGNAGAITVRAN